MRFILFLFLMHSSDLFAALIQEYRMDQVGGALHNIPVYDQSIIEGKGDSSICYAVTATQMYDAFQVTQNSNGHQFSTPWWTVIKYNFSHLKADYSSSGGDAFVALQALQRFGSCSHKTLFGDLSFNQVTEFESELSEFFDYDIKRLPRLEFPMINGKPDITKTPIRHVSNLTLEQQYNKLLVLLSRTAIDLNDPEILQNAELALQQKTYLAFVDLLYQKTCRSNFISVLPKEQLQYLDLTLAPQNTADTILKIKQILDTDLPLPIEITFCSDMFKDKNLNSHKNNYISSCSTHSSLIIGWRKKNNKFELLIRDSYGVNSCKSKSRYNKSYECNGGQIWIPIEIVVNNTRSISWIGSN